MRARTVVAALVLAFSVVLAVVLVACDNGTTLDCKPGTLRMKVQLNLTASLADTITVQAFAPPLLESFPHVPVGASGEVVSLDVTFPSGYPSDKLLNLLVRAYGKGQLIGETIEQIHLVPGCSVGIATISAQTVDAGPPTD